MEIIALDSHKRYSQVCVQKQDGQILCEGRIDHAKGEIRAFLSRWRFIGKCEKIKKWNFSYLCSPYRAWFFLLCFPRVTLC